MSFGKAKIDFKNSNITKHRIERLTGVLFAYSIEMNFDPYQIMSAIDYFAGKFY